jgi:hypothetical protein
MKSPITNPFKMPDPQDLWGDYHVEHWSDDDNSWFAMWLWGISQSIWFADQAVIRRVHQRVQEIIAGAKAGTIQPIEAIRSVKPLVLFTPAEREIINENAAIYGDMLARHFESPRVVN